MLSLFYIYFYVDVTFVSASETVCWKGCLQYNCLQCVRRCFAVDEADVIELEKQYWSLKGMSKSGRFDVETFTAAVSPPMPQELCQGPYYTWSRHSSPHTQYLCIGIYFDFDVMTIMNNMQNISFIMLA